MMRSALCLLLLTQALAFGSYPVGASYFQGQEISTPSNPPGGHDDIYFRSSDGLPVYLNSAGTITPFAPTISPVFTGQVTLPAGTGPTSPGWIFGSPAPSNTGMYYTTSGYTGVGFSYNGVEYFAYNSSPSQFVIENAQLAVSTSGAQFHGAVTNNNSYTGTLFQSTKSNTRGLVLQPWAITPGGIGSDSNVTAAELYFNLYNGSSFVDAFGFYSALHLATITSDTSDHLALSGGTGYSVVMPEITTPNNPPSGYLAIYPKSDNSYYSLTSGGVETKIGGGTPGGSTTQFQYNNAGSFGGSANLVLNGTTPAITQGHALNMNGATNVGHWGVGMGVVGSTLPFPLMSLPHASNGQTVLQIAYDEQALPGGFAFGQFNSPADFESINGSLYYNTFAEYEQGARVKSVLLSPNVAGFNTASPQYPVDATSVLSNLTAPATVTLTAHDSDPSIIGECVSGFDNTSRFNPATTRYDNNTTGCTADGLCYDLSNNYDPAYTDATSCGNAGETWYTNTFIPVTPGAPYLPIPVNGTVETVTVSAYNSTYGYYSPGTSQSVTINDDTDPGSFAAVQDESGSGYIANGTTYTWVIYSIYSTGLRSQGSTVMATDNSDSNPFNWDLNWSAPLGEAPTSYYVYNQTTGNAAYTASPSIVDDNTWSAFVDPGLAGIAYTTGWSSVSGAASYTLTQVNSQYNARLLGTSFVDYGLAPVNQLSPAPLGPFVATPGIHNDGVVLLKNTLTNNNTDATLQVWAGGNSSYAQQWFDNNGNLQAYIDNTGTFTGGLSPISGQFTTYDITANGTLTATQILNSSPGGSNTFQWQPGYGNNQLFRVLSVPTATLPTAANANVLYFDSTPVSGALPAGFGGNITFRTSVNPSPSYTPTGQLFYDMSNNTSSSTYLGEIGLAVYDHNNTTTPLKGLILDSNGTDVSVTIGTGTSAQHVLNTKTATNGSGVGTLTNMPTGVSGNPAGYEQITINGVTHYRPYW